MDEWQGPVEPLGLSPDFWTGRRVLLTGHTGFKGAWLSLWLRELGAEVTGLALEARTPSLFEMARLDDSVSSHLVDLRDAHAILDVVRTARPQVVLHLAAQALVPEGYADPVGTFATNVTGTVHLLEALRQRTDQGDGPGQVVVVTTDKVYANADTGSGFREDDPLGGKDPYSASKAACEHVVSAYRASYLAPQGVAVRTVRAGNVVGGGDFTPGRLLPDVLAAVARDEPLTLRSPNATRPWQHVLEPLGGYLRVVECLAEDPEAVPPALNFGPELSSCVSVRTVVDAVHELWGGGGEVLSEPASFAEAVRLELDVGLARERLGWTPRLDLGSTLAWTVTWERDRRAGADPRKLCLEHIRKYQGGAP